MKLNKELATLSEGRHRIVCPQCLGGSHKEKCLSVDVSSGGIQWNCFRAGCGNKGRVGDCSYVIEGSCSHTQAVDADKPGYNRFPIYDNSLVARGWEYRAQSKAHQPKSMLNTEGDWVNLHFPRRITEDVVLLVEDRRSSVAMSPYFPTVALLGVNLNDAKVNYMIRQGIKHAIIGLDNDATTQAIRLLKEWSFITNLIPLERDLKDETTARLLCIAGDLQRTIERSKEACI